jgi:hypothetical protein
MKTLTLEVGGTCDQGEIVFISDRTEFKILVVHRLEKDYAGWHSPSEITNYKPPMREVVHCRTGYNGRKMFFGEDSHVFCVMSTDIEGYWIPRVRV